MAGIDFQALPAADDVGRDMHELVRELFPIGRSITGNGLRRTLELIGERVPLEITEVPSGTQVLDWTVPQEWNLEDAWIEGPDGERVVDLRDSNLHVLGYSVPVRERLPLAELKEHLYSLPEQPDWIPFRNSYYNRNWGFCLQHRRLEALAEGEYEACIDSTLEDGSLTYGEAFVPGESEDEVLVSGYAAHPSMANDNLSGVALMTALAQHLAGMRLRYSYRFLFSPGTIGPITWLARNEERLEHVKHGLVCLCVGDPGPLTYKESRRGDAEVDRAARLVLRDSGGPLRGPRMGAVGRGRAPVQLAGVRPAGGDADPLGARGASRSTTPRRTISTSSGPRRWGPASTPTCRSSTSWRRMRPTST